MIWILFAACMKIADNYPSQRDFMADLPCESPVALKSEQVEIMRAFSRSDLTTIGSESPPLSLVDMVAVTSKAGGLYYNDQLHAGAQAEMLGCKLDPKSIRMTAVGGQLLESGFFKPSSNILDGLDSGYGLHVFVGDHQDRVIL